MRALNEQTILVTGATDGLGRYLAERLAADGARVVVHGRDPGRVAATAARIRAGAPDAKLETVLADLAELRQVDRLAAEVRERFDRLDVLVNNAGVGFGRPEDGRRESADGIELRFAVNYLAGHRLSRLLVPLLVASAPARVVNVASMGQYPVDFDDPMLTGGYDGVTAYRRAKLAQVMDTIDLAEELKGTGVTANALHPATFMDTTMVNEVGIEPVSTLEEGGTATLRLITDPSLDDVTGRFFDRERPARPNAQAEDPAARRRLRALAEELLTRAA
ncbi:SDR family NAD(P)-dependent oxidoreductase [Allonocardiopsis opalescens]|uniref:Short subunit dehydrogenase n=1 Tax=Allonocardiopsis opalescens TaxID=1144618 RepID=A0A2T0Q9P2_9ACTN|nr:SDR family NAD(P)-dependent oxidoreductase [Allonocardiopsis opalescens]PRY00588.1 short subunit dehydrogenase [Allonocardiopsis opalescens]